LRKWMTAVAVAALAWTLTACSSAVDPEPTSTSAEASPSATPGPEPTETSGPHEYTDQELIDMENESLPTNLEKYKTMPVDEFEQLPIEERLTYCSFLNRDQDMLETDWYKAYEEDTKYLIPDTLGKDSTGQEVISQDGYNISNAFTTHFGGMIDDMDTRIKNLSCATYNPNSLSRGAALKDEIERVGDFIVPPGAWAQQNALKINTFKSEEDPTTVTTDNGKEYFARKITSVDEIGRTFPNTYILVDYTDYRGQTRQTYVYYQ